MMENYHLFINLKIFNYLCKIPANDNYNCNMGILYGQITFLRFQNKQSCILTAFYLSLELKSTK